MLGIVQCDMISSQRQVVDDVIVPLVECNPPQVHHHFKWYKDGHKRTYTMHVLPVPVDLVESSGIAKAVMKPVNYTDASR